MKPSYLKIVSIPLVSTIEKIVIFLIAIFILNACSGKIKINLFQQPSREQTTSNVILVNTEGLIDRAVDFDTSDETNFLNYSLSCA